jgi:hypothetical protein
MARVTEPPVAARPRDEVLGTPSYFTDDPREKALRDAVYRAIARFGDRPGRAA